MEKCVAVIDLKSFYASCECSARHLDIFSTPLVCCDPYRSSSSIVMSATPYLKKKYGIPNVCRRRDLPRVPGMIYAVPRMSFYLQMSAKVNSIFLDYVAEEDLHVYSVDESFLNLGPYLNLYHCKPEVIVAKIQKDIKEKLGLVATAGIGPNMFLAKIALDQEGKKHEPYIAHWDYEDVPTKLWKINPITEIWGIAGGTSSHLARIGIHSLKELAEADVTLLSKEFGVMGYQLHQLANGIDDSDIECKYEPKEKGLSNGQTLRRDYFKDEAILLLREMNDDLARRLRETGAMARKVSLWIGYGHDGGAYAKQMTLPLLTDQTDSLYAGIAELFALAPDLPIRGLGISYGQLRQSEKEQLSLFEEPEVSQERKRLDESLDMIRSVYGPNSVLRCSSLLDGSTAKQRHEQIGGHKR
jgi:DNA polymerase V